MIVKLENTKSFFEIKILFVDLKRHGSFILKSKQELKEEKEKKQNDKQQGQKEKLKNRNQKNKTQKKKSLKMRAWFFQNIRYDEVQIFEKVGALDPFVTSMALPMIATVTTVPLHFLNVNYQNFHYQIIPDYNHLALSFELKAKASFRIIDFIFRIIKQKFAQIMS